MHSIFFLTHREPYHTHTKDPMSKFIVCGIWLKIYGNDDKFQGNLSTLDHGDH